MDNQLDISRLLLLRKVTRGISDLIGGQLRSHLQTLTPLFHPRSVLGEFVRGANKQSVKGEDDALQDLRRLYSSVATTAPFHLRKELETPLDLVSTTLEFAPAEYTHQANAGNDSKAIAVSTPLKWVVSYSGFGLKKMREFLDGQSTSGGNDLYQGLLHHLVLHVLFTRRAGLVRLLESMRFTVATERIESFGLLPITVVQACVRTLRPVDDVVIQSTEISGTAAFEEVVDLDAISGLRDPVKDQLLKLVQQFDPNLLMNH